MGSTIRMNMASWALALLLLLTLGVSCAAAQSDVIPKDLVNLFDQVSDIESLRALNPLKLTADQIGRISAEIRKASENHVKMITAAASPVLGMASEITAVRKKMLTGGEVPEEFDRRGRKISDDFAAKREAAKNKTLKSLSDAIREIFTPEQVAKAIAVSKKLTQRDGKPTIQGTDDQFFNFYVKAIFIDYPGILPLLDEVKKVRAEAGTNTTARAVSRRADQKVARR
jgi:hypothetical protein